MSRFCLRGVVAILVGLGVTALCGCGEKTERVAVYDDQCQSKYLNPLMRDIDLVVPKHNGARASQPQVAFRVRGIKGFDVPFKYECGAEEKEGYFCCNGFRDSSNEWRPYPK